MPKCAGCRTETDLLALDLPICTACVAERERFHPSLARLSAELTSAREIYRNAMEQFDRHEAMCQGLPKEHPQRTVAAHVGEKAQIAGGKYWEALRVYSVALQRRRGKTPSAT